MTRRNQRSAEAQAYRHLYSLKAWRGKGGVRNQVLIRDGYTCRMCKTLLTGRKGQANAPEVDHIIDHLGDLDLFLDIDNLQSLCAFPCHAKHKQVADRRGYSTTIGPDGWPIDENHPANGGTGGRRWGYSIPHGVQPSAIPVTLVYGPPASGKTTYVQEHAQPGDVVIDFDDICVRVGGVRWNNDPDTLRLAFRHRDQIIRSLARRKSGAAWLIALAPTEAERSAWQKALGQVTPVLMDTTEAECLDRLAAPERAHAAQRQASVVREWFRLASH